MSLLKKKQEQKLRKTRKNIIKFMKYINYPNCNPKALYSLFEELFCPTQVQKEALVLIAQNLDFVSTLDDIKSRINNEGEQFKVLLTGIFKYLNTDEVADPKVDDTNLFCGLMFALLHEYKHLDKV